MFYRFPIISTGALLLGAASAAAAELPVYEVSGLPITPHQVAVVGPANAEQSDFHFTYTRRYARISASDFGSHATRKTDRTAGVRDAVTIAGLDCNRDRGRMLRERDHV